MKRLWSALAVTAGLAATTLVYVAFGITWGGLLMSGVEVDAEYNPTAAGLVRFAFNTGLWMLALTALGGFVAALLAPGRRWRHGLGVGVAICAVIVLLWLNSARHGQQLAVSGGAVLSLTVILVGSALGGYLGQALAALVSRGRRRFGSAVDEVAD